MSTDSEKISQVRLNKNFWKGCKGGDISFVKKNLTHEKINPNFLLKGPNDSEFTCLGISIVKNQIEIVKLLLRTADINVNQYNYQFDYIKKSNLFLAVENLNVEIVKLLLSHKKINPNVSLVSTPKKCSCLAFLLSKRISSDGLKEIQIFKLLLEHEKEHKINPNIGHHLFLNDKYETPLCISIRNKNMKIFKLLINHKSIKINKACKISKITALHLSNKLGYNEMTKILLNCPNIDIKRKDSKGKVASQYCKSEKIMKLFKKIEKEKIQSPFKQKSPYKQKTSIKKKKKKLKLSSTTNLDKKEKFFQLNYEIFEYLSERKEKVLNFLKDEKNFNDFESKFKRLEILKQNLK